ncbi:MAG: phosphatase PAP2 family protein, partial [Treponema sp.]|nr:phosphatase PAP2 family protein [Treponema sp.]
GMKICFRIDRPWIADPSLSPVQSAVKHATGYSFPSGHTQSATALFGTLGMQVKNIPFKTICFIIVILVAFSRMYLGVHTPLDVITSLIISSLLIALTIIFYNDTICKTRELIIALVMILYAAAVIVIAAVLYSNGTIERHYLSDCLKAAGAGIGFAAGMYVERLYINFSVKAKNILWQIIKFTAGLAGVLLIKEGLKLIIGTGLAVDTVRYFLMLLWVTMLYPLVIRKFFTAE